jgi:GntR family transcriptional repressor for pyruvate dehydrogenase complex
MGPIAVRPHSLVERVALRLAQVIRSELLQVGGWLPAERELSAQLGVSRNVVREATKRLETQGLVEIQHGVGIRAVNHLHRPLNESLSFLIPDLGQRLHALTQARLSIEPDAAALAAAHATRTRIRELREVHDRLESAVDIESAVDADCAFHQAIAEAGGNPIFRLVLDSLAELGRSSRVRSMGHAGKQRAIEHHAAVLKAIENGCAESARRAMRKHLVAAAEDLGLGESSKGSRSE